VQVLRVRQPFVDGAAPVPTDGSGGGGGGGGGGRSSCASFVAFASEADLLAALALDGSRFFLPAGGVGGRRYFNTVRVRRAEAPIDWREGRGSSPAPLPPAGSHPAAAGVASAADTDFFPPT